MKDNYGDKISIETDDEDVALTVYDKYVSDPACASLTPAKARKLAKKLNKAADEVEGIERIDVEPRGYTLTLTEDQAKTLAAIFYRIGGTAGTMPGQITTARKYVEQMRKQLDALGVNGEDVDNSPRFRISDEDRAIYFIGVAE